jgi:hypothetical protein
MCVQRSSRPSRRRVCATPPGKECECSCNVHPCFLLVALYRVRVLLWRFLCVLFSLHAILTINLSRYTLQLRARSVL